MRCINVQTVSLSGWKVIHKAGDEETVFKFHRSTKLAAGEIATVSNLEIFHLLSSDRGAIRPFSPLFFHIHIAANM